MLIVSLDAGGVHKLFSPDVAVGIENVWKICMCVQNGFYMYRREYPTDEELEGISYEVALVHSTTSSNATATSSSGGSS